MSEDTRTLKQLAQEALDVQDGVNLVALLGGWQRSAQRLRALGFGGEAGGILYSHPIHRLWISKIASLCGTQEEEDWFRVAYDEVVRLAEAEEEQWDST